VNQHAHKSKRGANIKCVHCHYDENWYNVFVNYTLNYHATACCHDQHVKRNACYLPYLDHALEQHKLQCILHGSDARLKENDQVKHNNTHGARCKLPVCAIAEDNLDARRPIRKLLIVNFTGTEGRRQRDEQECGARNAKCRYR